MIINVVKIHNVVVVFDSHNLMFFSCCSLMCAKMPNYILHHHFPPSNPSNTNFLAESDFFGKICCNDFFGIAYPMTSRPDQLISKPLKVRQVIRLKHITISTEESYTYYWAPLMRAKRKFSDQNAQITENPSGGCAPATAILNSGRIAIEQSNPI